MRVRKQIVNDRLKSSRMNSYLKCEKLPEMSTKRKFDGKYLKYGLNTYCLQETDFKFKGAIRLKLKQ